MIDNATADRDSQVDVPSVLMPLAAVIALAAVFVMGLLLAANSVDDYSYGAGLAFAGFTLFLLGRYLGPRLPR